MSPARNPRSAGVAISVIVPKPYFRISKSNPAKGIEIPRDMVEALPADCMHRRNRSSGYALSLRGKRAIPEQAAQEIVKQMA